MPVIDVVHDTDALTLTIVAVFAAPTSRVWQVYADPRQLEKVFGPPTHPATFLDHDLRPGSRSTYYLTSPQGERYYGLWDITTVQQGVRFTFEDAFADEHFQVAPDLPVSHSEYSFAARDGGTRATYVSTFASAAALQQVLDMGVVEGASSAIDQVDGLLIAG